MSREQIPTNRGNIPLRKWWKTTPLDIEALCQKADVKLTHFKQVAAGRRAFSPNVARVFIDAAGGALKLDDLVFLPKVKAPARKAKPPAKAVRSSRRAKA